jgi:hypothetical protein
MPMRHWTALLVAFLLASNIHAQPTGRLWVLQAPDQVVEYDLVTFAPRGAVTVPGRIVEHPEYLSANAKGQMLFLPPEGLAVGTGPLAGWFWDGRQSREMKPTGRVFLTADGQSLVWFENTFDKVTDPDADRSVKSSARVWRTDLAGGAEQTLVSIPVSASCECTTGVCSETCPEWSMWAPDGVVSDLFLMTRFVPGQLQTSYEETVAYRRSGQRWQPARLGRPLERVLAAAANGVMLISTVIDPGCCGWINEGSDETALLIDGRRSVLFDEWTRFDNRNYDVSFYTTAAQFAPGGQALVAHTIDGDAIGADGDIRLSSEGKENAQELARVRAAIADLPLAEIVRLVRVGSPPQIVKAIRHAAVVGWLSERELLVAQEGHLAVYDASGNKIRDTPIRVRSAADAWLR